MVKGSAGVDICEGKVDLDLRRIFSSHGGIVYRVGKGAGIGVYAEGVVGVCVVGVRSRHGKVGLDLRRIFSSHGGV